MKNFDTQVLASVAKPASSEAALQQEPNAQLKSRLWQLLLPVPDKLLEASATGTDTAPKHSDDRDARAHSAASELAATAYLLAGYVQRLSLHGDNDFAVAEESAHRPGLQQAISLRVDANTATGGLASLELSHPELGAVGLAVELASGAVRITATATSARSAEVIQQGQAALAQRLLRQGIALEALDVVVVKPKQKPRSAKRARPRKEDQET